MSKTLFYRWFRAGEIPKKLLPTIKEEGVLYQEEGISCATHFRKFRAPGKYYSYKVVWGSGSIVLTKLHLLAFRYSTMNIGVSWQEMKQRKMEYYVDDKSRLCIAYDAATFDEKWSGNVEVKYLSEQPQELLKIMDEKLT